MIGLTIDQSEFRQRFPRLIELARNPRALMLGVGREVGNLLKRHFREKDQTNPNRLSDRREHLWLRISQSVQSPVLESTAVSVSINDPVMAQKVFGGPIVAKRVRNLSIPQSADAYGRSPATFERETGRKLILLKTHGKLLLASRLSQQSTALQVEYLLTPRVQQSADPTALPDEQQLTTAILDRGQRIVDRQIQQDV